MSRPGFPEAFRTPNDEARLPLAINQAHNPQGRRFKTSPSYQLRLGIVASNSGLSGLRLRVLERWPFLTDATIARRPH
jgi:hypothetical protein